MAKFCIDIEPYVKKNGTRVDGHKRCYSSFKELLLDDSYFAAFINNAQGWQNEHTYRSVDIEGWKKLFYALPKIVQKRISVTNLDEMYFGTQMEVEDLLNGTKVLSLSNKSVASFFANQRGGSVYSSDIIKSYSVALSYDKMARYFDVGDDEGEVVLFDVVFDRDKIRKETVLQMRDYVKELKERIDRDQSVKRYHDAFYFGESSPYSILDNLSITEARDEQSIGLRAIAKVALGDLANARTISKKLGIFTSLLNDLNNIKDAYPTSGLINSIERAIKKYNNTNKEDYDWTDFVKGSPEMVRYRADLRLLRRLDTDG